MDTAERLAIVQDCTQMIAKFAMLNDDRDADGLADMFVEDGAFTRPSKPDAPIAGRENIRAGFKARPPGKMTRHIVANTIVEVVSASEARAVSYLILYTADQPEGAALPLKADAKQLLGAFHDTMVRDTDGVWKFKERRGSLAMTIGG